MADLVPTSGQNPDQSSRVVQVGYSEPSINTARNGDSYELNLREAWLALKRRKKLVLITAGAVFVFTALTTAYERAYKPLYKGSFSLLITDPISQNLSSATSVSSTNSMFEQLALNSTRNNIPTLVEFLKSPLSLAEVSKRFNLNSSALGNRITIQSGSIGSNKQSTGVLNVSLTTQDPTKDKALLIAISNAYLQSALQERQQQLADGIAFLNKQAPALEKKTDSIQSELAAFRRQHSTIQPRDKANSLKIRETELASQILVMESERTELLNVRNQIVSGILSARGFEGMVKAGRDGNLSISEADRSLLKEMLKVETELAEARLKYIPKSTMVRNLETRLNQLQPLLRKKQQQAVNAALSFNSSRLAIARSQKRKLNIEFLQQPGLMRQYEALETRLNISRENLSGLVKARERFQLEIAQRSVPWRVMSPPLMNKNPIKPSIPRNLARGAFMGLIIGAGLGLLRDRFDHVFHNPGEVKEDLDLPLLGHVPHVALFKGVHDNKRLLLEELNTNNNPGDEDNQAEHRYQRFFYQEALRNLFTSIRFLNSDRPLQAIGLTSSVPAEGKSLVNILLAKTLSEMGKKVLLVDADLRKPQMHVRLGLNNLTGLSNLLTEEGLHWRKVVQSVPNFDNWQVITAGRRPPDPTRLLSSRRMQIFVNELTKSKDYDLVLFDTPPVLGLADAALVSEHCDGLVLLVSLDRVDRGLPKEAVARIRTSGVPLLGIVTNSVKKDMHNSSNRYGYGYGYGRYGGYGGYSYASYANFDSNEFSGTQLGEIQPDKKQIEITGRNRIIMYFKKMPWLPKVINHGRTVMRWLDS